VDARPVVDLAESGRGGIAESVWHFVSRGGLPGRGGGTVGAPFDTGSLVSPTVLSILIDRQTDTYFCHSGRIMFVITYHKEDDM